MGYAILQGIELLGGFYGKSQRDFKEHEIVFNVGTRYELVGNIFLLFSAGRGIFSSGDNETELISYLGIQFLF